MSLEHILNKKHQGRSIYDGDLFGMEQEQSFRPWKWEDEITENDWHEMEKQLEKYKLPGDNIKWHFYMELVNSMCVINSKYKININNSEEKEIKKWLERYQRKGNWYNFAMRIAFLRKIKQIENNEDNEIKLQEIMSILENERKHGNWSFFARLASDIFLVDSKQAINIKKTEWDEMEKLLEIYRKNSDWINFTKHASNMRIIDSSHKINITETDWKEMEYLLECHRINNYWDQFADQAACMRILAAYKVEVFKKGIEITDEPQKPLVVSPPRPVRRMI